MDSRTYSPYKLLIAAALLIPAILFLVIIWQDYHTILNTARAEVTRTTKIFEQHAFNVFETHQLVAERINDRLKDLSWDEIEHSSEVRDYLRNIEKEYPQVFALWLADSAGIVRNSSKALPAAPVSVADRDYFQALSTSNIGLFIGHVVKPRIMNSLNFNVAYRRGGAEGRFNGVIIVTSSPDYFSNFWNSVTSRQDSVAILLRSDGSILSRSLGLNPDRLKFPADSAPMKAISGSHEGSYIAASMHDGTERIYGFNKIDKFPIYAFYGLNMKSVLHKWHRHILIYGVFFTLAVLVLVLFALSAQKHARKLQASREALRESEKMYRAIGESIDYGIWICDADGRNLYASESFLTLVGMTQEQCANFGWGDRLHPDDAERTISAWKECVKTGGAWDIEHRFLGVDGQWHPVLARGVPVRDSRGRIIKWVGINLDIRRMKQAEEELKKINEQLDHLVAERTRELEEKNLLLLQQSRLAAMGEMIQHIAHQWRQPLNAVGLYVQSLLTCFDNGNPDRALLKTVTGETMKLIRHMSQTIDDFRNFFKPDKEKTEFGVAELIRKTLSLVNDGFMNNHIEVVSSVEGEPRIYGHFNELCQVLLNVLQNARDALEDRKISPGRVEIAARDETDRAVITITDNAGGIPDEIIGRIFEPYFSTKGVQGTGIGLYMSRNILENMGSTISVRNTSQGAEFRIEFPPLQAGEKSSLTTRRPAYEK